MLLQQFTPNIICWLFLHWNLNFDAEPIFAPYKPLKAHGQHFRVTFLTFVVHLLCILYFPAMENITQLRPIFSKSFRTNNREEIKNSYWLILGKNVSISGPCRFRNKSTDFERLAFQNISLYSKSVFTKRRPTVLDVC